MTLYNKQRKIQVRLLLWFKKYGRRFPWRQTKDPYKIYIAETLLQKTNVEKVLPSYLLLLGKYPTIKKLAKARVGELKILIRSLGLIKRAAYLILGAKQVIKLFNSEFPKDKKELKRIIGVGDYMAHAILCYSFSQRLPLVDTNVARVYGRLYNRVSDKLPYADRQLWDFSAKVLPQKRFKEYNFALLDLSALICLPKNPLCFRCPCKQICLYYRRRNRYRSQ